MGPSAISDTQIAIKTEPTLSPIPVIRWKIEKTDVRIFLWIERCGDKGLLVIIEKIFKYLLYLLSIFFFEKFKKNTIWFKLIKDDICGKECG